MRSLSVSNARSKLPSLLDDVIAKHETILISRKGKVVAQLAPISSGTSSEEKPLYPLRAVSISIPDDFDEPMPELWDVLR